MCINVLDKVPNYSLDLCRLINVDEIYNVSMKYVDCVRALAGCPVELLDAYMRFDHSCVRASPGVR
jgi:hypothetical protein